MIRVLQLLDLDAGFQAARGAATLARELGADFEVRAETIRGGGIARTLARLQRPASDVIVHAWGGRALAAANLVGAARVVYSPSDSPSAGSLKWARAAMGYRDIQVICPSATLRRAYIERGMPLGRCHLIRPGVEFGRIKRRRDNALRAALGFEAGDRVLLLPGESTRASNHRAAMWAAAILHVIDPKYRVLCWGRGEDVAGVTAYARHQKQPRLISAAEQRLKRAVEFEELLPAADIVLATADRPVATLPVVIGMAAALPIVATASEVLSELLEDRHTALLARPGSPKLLARRVLDLEEDANLQWAIADMARTEAYEYFALTRFLNQHRSLYRQTAEGAAVELPEHAAGPGLRFHGRG